MTLIYVVELYLCRDMSRTDDCEREYLFTESEDLVAFFNVSDVYDFVEAKAKEYEVDLDKGPKCWDGIIHHYRFKPDPTWIPKGYSDIVVNLFDSFFENINYQRDEIGVNIKTVQLMA